MQVLSRQRDISLMNPRKPQISGACTYGSTGMPLRAVGCLWRRGCGFSLVELMITLAVAVMLTLIAIPSFTNISLTNKLTTTANDLVGAINSARMEAIKLDADTQVCSDSAASNTADTLGSGCSLTVQPGAVYVLTGGGTTATATPLLAAPPGITAPLQLNGSLIAVRFTGQGLGQTPGTSTPYTGPIVDICTSRISTNNHRVVTMTAGSILVTTSSSGACPSS